jgi:hypothetical protein
MVHAPVADLHHDPDRGPGPCGRAAGGHPARRRPRAKLALHPPLQRRVPRGRRTPSLLLDRRLRAVHPARAGLRAARTGKKDSTEMLLNGDKAKCL